MSIIKLSPEAIVIYVFYAHSLNIKSNNKCGLILNIDFSKLNKTPPVIARFEYYGSTYSDLLSNKPEF